MRIRIRPYQFSSHFSISFPIPHLEQSWFTVILRVCLLKWNWELLLCPNDVLVHVTLYNRLRSKSVLKLTWAKNFHMSVWTTLRVEDSRTLSWGWGGGGGGTICEIYLLEADQVLTANTAGNALYASGRSRRKEDFWNNPEPLFFLTNLLQEKQPEPKLLGYYISLTGPGEGKYLSPVSSCHALPLKEGEKTCQVSSLETEAH